MQEILIFGNGGHAKVVIDAARIQNKYTIYDVIPDRPASFLLTLKVKKGIVALGDNWRRHIEVAKILLVIPDFEFITVIHPLSVVANDCQIGPGSFIAAGAVVNPGCEIGQHCIVNTSVSLDHDSTMGNFSSLAPGSHTGGHCTINEFSSVSLCASIIHGITIGAHSVIGAGSVVVKSVPHKVVAHGNPCRIIRPRNIGEKYL